MRDLDDLPASVLFLHLAIDQARSYLPSAGFSPAMSFFLPVSKMSAQSIKGPIEAITGEKWEAVRSEHLSEGMNEHMCHLLRTRAEMKHRKNRA